MPLLLNDLRDAADEIQAYHKLYKAVKATWAQQPGLTRRAIEQLEDQWKEKPKV